MLVQNTSLAGMAKNSLPPGFRFHPTDVELVAYYLKRKVLGKPLLVKAISEIDIYKFAPWDLPDKSCLQTRDLEWYFFCPRDRKYPNGSRMNRATAEGYWKTSGKDRTITLNSRAMGTKKTLIFHEGKAPKGNRTDWVMYEYKLEDNELAAAGVAQDAFVLCKIFKKSGLGPRIGEQYGAPFDEAEWKDDMGDADLFREAGQYAVSTATEAVSSLAHCDTSVYTAPFSEAACEEDAVNSIITQYAGPSGASMVTEVDLVTPHNTSGASPAVQDISILDYDIPQLDNETIKSFFQFLEDSPPLICNRNNEFVSEASGAQVNAAVDPIYNELEDIIEDHNACAATTQDYVHSELGADDDYVELSDLFPLAGDGVSESNILMELQHSYGSGATLPVSPSAAAAAPSAADYWLQTMPGTSDDLFAVVSEFDVFGD